MSGRKFFNRELSWLEFNQRVLDEARDPGVPLLERLKFLAITSSNLDEFFMVRVGGLQLMLGDGGGHRDPSGLLPRQQLQAISTRSHRMVGEQQTCFLSELEPLLRQAGIHRRAIRDLTDREKEYADQFFDAEVYPVVTPTALVEGGELPLLANRGLHVAARLRLAPAPDGGGERFRYAFLPLGQALGRMLRLPATGGHTYLLLEELMAGHVDQFFPGEDVVETAVFRITRNADLSVREDQAADLLSQMQAVLTARKRSDCVRLEVAAGATRIMRDFLQRTLEVDELFTFEIAGPLDLSGLLDLARLGGFDHLRDPAWPPQASARMDAAKGMFEVIRAGDLLLFHPQQSFDPVIRFIEEAAVDPDVLAIKQILYRTSRQSPIIAALARAAERGKYVTAIVELKARFDEERNIEWARALEEAGVQVIYGIKGLKTHAKVCIVVRREPQGLRRYMHFGTGNYNEVTARAYTDISFMTCDADLGADASAFFNTISGYSQPLRYRKLEQAPLGLRDAILGLIDGEAERCRQGQKAVIMAKLNALVDPVIIRALYAASQAGVEIKLNVRGVCCLKPGVPGLSENITVISIIDRFLEHDRILYFLHGGAERVFISSADWMPRNLDRRIELLVPIEDRACRKALLRLLQLRFKDTAKARLLRPDGSYERVQAPGGKDGMRSQEALYKLACDELSEAQKSKPTVFEPHRAPATAP
ncbi:MAG: polyphosphate kinase 1 [Lentisphaerae bacterium]|nr:polyphosphate kinase 1 [Lentisphaerota bacterium]